MFRMDIITEEYRERLYPIAWFYLKEGYDDGGDLLRQEGLMDRIKSGQAQLWLLSENSLVEGAAATEIWELAKTKKKVLHVPLAGGELVKGMGVMIQAFENFARTMGIDEVALTVRPGIAKLSRAYGYRTNTIEVRHQVESQNGQEIRETSSLNYH